MVSREATATTIAMYKKDVEVLERWLAQRGRALLSATEPHIVAFMAWRTDNGMKDSSIARELTSLRHFYRYALSERAMDADPTKNIPKPAFRKTPLVALTDEEIDALLKAPDIAPPTGHRDGAILEVLCGTGIRASDLAVIKLEHVELERRLLFVPERGRHRAHWVPLYDAARYWIRDDQKNSRAKILRGRKCDYLFPTRRSIHMTRQSVWHIVKRYAKKAAPRKKINPEMLRMTFVVRMLESGVSVSDIGESLGHSDGSTTRYLQKRSMAI